MTSTKLTMMRGDTKTFNLSLKDGNGAAINITDWVIFFTVKASDNDEDASAVIKKDITVHSDPTQGLSSFTVASGDTVALTASNYIYDIQTKSNTGTILTIAKGAFAIEADVTRRTAVSV